MIQIHSVGHKQKQVVMRTAKFLGVMLVAGAFFVSCSKKKQIEEIEKNVQDGTWKVTSFVDSGDDHTSDFTGYAFTFSPNGDAIAVNGGTTVSGTWSISTSSSDDDSNDDMDFNLSFASPADFEELTDDWDVKSHSSTKIELIDVSGGNGGTDYLTFEKI